MSFLMVFVMTPPDLGFKKLFKLTLYWASGKIIPSELHIEVDTNTIYIRIVLSLGLSMAQNSMGISSDVNLIYPNLNLILIHTEIPQHKTLVIFNSLIKT